MQAAGVNKTSHIQNWFQNKRYCNNFSAADLLGHHLTAGSYPPLTSQQTGAHAVARLADSVESKVQ